MKWQQTHTNTHTILFLETFQRSVKMIRKSYRAQVEYSHYIYVMIPLCNIYANICTENESMGKYVSRQHFHTIVTPQYLAPEDSINICALTLFMGRSIKSSNFISFIVLSYSQHVLYL